MAAKSLHENQIYGHHIGLGGVAVHTVKDSPQRARSIQGHGFTLDSFHVSYFSSIHAGILCQPLYGQCCVVHKY